LQGASDGRVWFGWYIPDWHKWGVKMVLPIYGAANIILSLQRGVLGYSE